MRPVENERWYGMERLALGYLFDLTVSGSTLIGWRLPRLQ